MQKTLFLFLALGLINVSVHGQTAPLTSTVQNYISNGDFSQNNCPVTDVYCLSTDKAFVKDWIPDPQIEIGYAYDYIDNFQSRTERVLQLTADKNTCVRQNINFLPPGCYKVAVQYSARKGFPFTNAQFSISINGILLKNVTPTSYAIQSEVIDIQTKNGCGAELRLCGIGRDDKTDGAIIKSVKLVQSVQGSLQSNVSPIIIDGQGVPALPILNPTLPLPTNPFPYISLPSVNPYPVIPTPIPILTLVPTPTPNPVFKPTELGLYLESHSNKCFQKQFNTNGGEIEFTFDYKIISNSTAQLRSSAMIVSLDGKQIQSVLPFENGKNLKVSLSKPSKGLHSVTLCPFGNSNEPTHIIHVSNILIDQKVCLGQWTKNLVKNGGFEETTCKAHYCIFYQNLWKTENLPGWFPNPQIEVGIGTAYNSRLINTNVAELAPNKNSCMKQKLALKQGKYTLSFKWVAREHVALTSQGYQVKINGKVIKSGSPTNYEIQKESIEFELTSLPAESQLQFCGTGGQDCYGVLIDNVELNYFEECPNFKVFKFGPFPRNIVNASNYDPQAVNTPGFYIESNAKCSQIRLNLQGGDVQSSFDFQILAERPLINSALIVTFDGKPILTVPASESGKRQQFKIPKTVSGLHTLGLCSYPNPNEPSHTVFVSNFLFKETQCTEAWTSDLIYNGGFQETICKGAWCKYSEGNWKEDFVPGWLPSSEIEVGMGSNYNYRFKDTNVAELDATRNTCIKQKIPLKPGKYSLSFSTGARQCIGFDSQGYEAKVNGRIIKSGRPTNYQISNESVEFELGCVYDESFIEFCGIGKGDEFGSVIDNVKLIYFDQCVNFREYNYFF